MIWLASYPRSGNTFLRNILHQVYGLESTAYNLERKQEIDRNSMVNGTFGPIVKTHLMPDQIPFENGDQVIYLIRDGRDSNVSRAYKKKNIHLRYSNLYVNLLNFIHRGTGKDGTWSENVDAWTKRATLIIKFEDLIEDPIHQINRLNSTFKMPPSNLELIPTFEKQKKGESKYGEFPSLFFRKGTVGDWKNVMPKRYVWLFHKLHGETLLKNDYSIEDVSFSKVENIIYHLTYVEAIFFRLINGTIYRILSKFFRNNMS